MDNERENARSAFTSKFPSMEEDVRNLLAVEIRDEDMRNRIACVLMVAFEKHLEETCKSAVPEKGEGGNL